LEGEPYNKSFQPTKPFVTRLAGARPAPNAFAAEADVRLIGDSMGRTLIALVILAHLAFVNVPVASGSCAPQPPKIHYVKADYVFTGVPVSFVNIYEPNELPRPHGHLRYRFKVAQIWKGPVVEEIEVLAGDLSNSMNFEGGRHYLVYARQSIYGEAYTGNCMGTGFVEDKLEEIKMFGPAWVVSEDLLLPGEVCEKEGRRRMRPWR